MTFKPGDQVRCPNGLIGTVMDASETPYIAPRGSVHVRFNCGLCDTIRLVDLRRLSSIQIQEPWQTPLVLALAADPTCPAKVLRDALLEAGCSEGLVHNLCDCLSMRRWVGLRAIDYLKPVVPPYLAGNFHLPDGTEDHIFIDTNLDKSAITRWLWPYLTRLAEMASSQQLAT